MKNEKPDKKMKLAALVDFCDDARDGFFDEETMDKMVARFKQAGVERMYFQYYGNRDYGWFWDHQMPVPGDVRKTAEHMPNFSRVFVDAAKRHGMETAVVMRPHETGAWYTFSPYYKETAEYPGIKYTGGDIAILAHFARENPELRIKRRSWDIDPDAENKDVYKIKLYKQNDVESCINADNLTIYVSPDNCNYTKYEGNFTLEKSIEAATKEVTVFGRIHNYETSLITKVGDPIEVITLSGFCIKERYIAVGVNCPGKRDEKTSFINAPYSAIAIFDENGEEICATPGGDWYGTPTRVPHIKAGFNFDDGFGSNGSVTFDKEDKEGYFAICKGKNEYVHAALCVMEPKVQEFWFKLLDQAIDDGYDFVGNRIECHSVHVDDPFAYGYNDCIKEEYFKRYGKCCEQEMELDKIAKIRGDAYTELFIEGAKRVRARGRKVYLTLNAEMLYQPIPIARHFAYPMNIEWQWERWIEEIRPDEINIRTFCFTPDFVLNDEQCRHFIEVAQKYDVPITYERYPYWDFAKDFEQIRDTGIFSGMTLYETQHIVQSDGKGGLIEKEPELLKKLEKLTKE